MLAEKSKNSFEDMFSLLATSSIFPPCLLKNIPPHHKNKHIKSFIIKLKTAPKTVVKYKIFTHVSK